MLRSRAALIPVIVFAAVATAAITFIATSEREDEVPALLGAVEGECSELDVSPYNSVMADGFAFAPFMTFDHADRSSTYGSAYSTCETTPDLDNLCETGSQECTDLIYVAGEHNLWVDIAYDCDGFCGLTEEEAAEIPEKEKVEGWDWAVPAFASRQLSGEDRMNGGTYHGQLISVYQYENLQITIDLELGYAPERTATEEDLNRYDEDLQRFAALNQTLAEDIRDSAIARRENASG